MESKLDEISSWTSYTPLTHTRESNHHHDDVDDAHAPPKGINSDGALCSIEETVAAAAAVTAVRPPEHENVNSCNLQETLNISDSYNDNDNGNGNETRKVQVNFQWIRPHPALFLQAQPASTSTSTSTSTSSCVEASKIVNAHARKRLKQSFQIQNSAKRSASGLLESSGPGLKSKELESDSGTTRRRSCIRNETLLPINDNPGSTSTNAGTGTGTGTAFICPPEVTVDLTKLFDPVLHSEFIPGQDVSTDYGDTSRFHGHGFDTLGCTNTKINTSKTTTIGVHGSDCEDEGGRNESNGKDVDKDKDEINIVEMKKALNAFVTSVVDNEMGRENSIKKQTVSNRAEAMLLIQDLMSLSTKDWANLLPSHEFRMLTQAQSRTQKQAPSSSEKGQHPLESQSQSYVAGVDTNADGIIDANANMNANTNSDVAIVCKVFGELLAWCPSRPLGLHMLAILIPVAFDTSYIPEVMVMVMPSNQIIMKLKEIAKLLISSSSTCAPSGKNCGYRYGYGCGLGNLPRGELLGLAKNVPRNCIGMELNKHVAAEYYKFNINKKNK